MTIILCDVDGVLADFIGELCRKALPGRTPKDFTRWKLEENLDTVDTAYAEQTICSPGFCEGLPLYPGAKGFLKSLRKVGQVIALTACTPTRHWPGERIEWCVKRGFDRQDIILCPGPRKRLVFGHYLIEDRLDTALQWQDKNIFGQAILIDRPWNQGNTHGVKRVHSYNEALNAISFT